MLPVTRLMDIGLGTCIAHPPIVHVTTGKVITSQSTVLVNGRPCARLTDMVITDCGGVGIIITGNNTTLISGLPISRLTSMFVGTFTGTIITGSDNTYSVK
jgi:uncharacterized Zn-binding protein involved in type VI secretion